MNLLTRLYVLLILAVAAVLVAAEAGAPRHPARVASPQAHPMACTVPDDPPACAAAPERQMPLHRPAF
ncbi:MAG: hypothetical protein JO264_06435 [Acidisphaera sp.]|nr:hypothetical protein [Acidisphaera sp.]